VQDRWLARVLHEHKVLTTQQIIELCSATMRAANHRLLADHRLDRIRRCVDAAFSRVTRSRASSSCGRRLSYDEATRLAISFTRRRCGPGK
jgi:hypothetical protein